jgi:hypothetical protein
MLVRRITRRKFLKYVGIGAVAAVIATSGIGAAYGLPNLFQAKAQELDYQTVVTTEFIPRMQAALNNMRNSLILSGVNANNITVQELDSNDLRWQIVVRDGSQTLTGYIELTDGLNLTGDAGRGQAIFTLWCDVNGFEVTTSYSPEGLHPYATTEGLQALLSKLSQVESTIPEAIVKSRAALGL